MNTVFLERICRCCLNESESMSSLFDRVGGIESFTFEQHFTYSDLIFMCTNVRCDLDVIDANEHVVELPRNVCELCLQELRAAFIFRQKCESNDHLLREQTVGLSSHSTEEIVEFDQTTDDRKISKTITIEKIDRILPNECVFYDNEKQILVAVNEPNSNRSNEIELEIVSVNCDTIENLPFVPEQQTTDAISTFNNKSCKICKEDFHSASDLRAHIRQQHSTKNYKCSVCPEEFHTEKGLLAHSSSHEELNKNFLCSICDKTFTTKARLEVHAATHAGEKNHACDECDKKFSSESRLRCHRRTHTGEKPYRCDQCDLTFAQGNALRCHKRIHTGEKPYECQFCNKRFTQNTILKTHMTLHTGKKIKCDFPDCDKMFSRASNLILHRREHTGEKPYCCTQCPNRYKQKSHLDRHMDTHLGVKHTCPICKKDYSKRWSLKVHMFTHSKIKPHRCSLCIAEFTRRDKFRNHLKSIHGLIPPDNPNNSTLTLDNTNEDTS
ncbi:zinc finger protein 25-like [Sitodiplosis mosellana]|uniref:zinc finger protein 25-like n=1 Tax=Sitodiplosis mosellana TaxID=263140 RepID=UPI002443C5D1|nr:zinc finger protein 25-like [Sitodiplosis mosellana]